MVKRAGAASVGLEFLDSGYGGSRDATEELPLLLAGMDAALRDAAAFFASPDRPTFRRQGSMLAFDSPTAGDGPNSIARAQIYDSGRRDLLLDSGLDEFRASLDAATPETYLAIRGVPT